VYVLPAALTNPQVDQFVGLLAYQFGLTSLLPSTHTYKVFPPLARNIVLNMNNYGITAIPTNTTDVTGAINLSQLNSTVNTLCGVSNNTPKACITADGTISMSGNLNLNSNKVVSLATPTNTTDAANKTYVDTAVGNLFVGLFAQTIGPETTSTSTTSSQVQKTFTITNSLFTSLTILHPVIIVYNQSSTNYTDAFVGTVRSMSLSGTTLTLNINVTRIDVSGVGTWGESPTCDILVFIR
jgi:hypothetical protein